VSAPAPAPATQPAKGAKKGNGAARVVVVLLAAAAVVLAWVTHVIPHN
jgi:hypothetical protein